MSAKKIALVADGGGNSGAFYGGFLETLAMCGIDFRHFWLLVGTSVGATTLAFFLTNQIVQGMRYFTKHLPKGYIRWRNWKGLWRPYADMKYMEWAFRNSEDALDVATLKARTQQLYMSVSDPKTGKGRYACLNTEDDPVLVMLKGIHAPWFAFPDELPGERLHDGGLTKQPPICHPLLKEADEIWYISPYLRDYRPNRWLMRLYAWWVGRTDPAAAKLIANSCALECAARDQIERRSDLKIIRPDRRLLVDWRTSDVGTMIDAIDSGREAAYRFMKKQKF